MYIYIYIYVLDVLTPQARFSSVSHHFSNQLNLLLVSLKETNSTFVRCINPNTAKEANAFAGGQVHTHLYMSLYIDV